MRESVAGRKPTSGSMSRLASSSFEPYDCVKEPSSASNPCSQTSRWISSRTTRQRSTGPSNPCSSTVRTARSNATHAIAFEWTKWRPPPRLLGMAEQAELDLPALRIDRQAVHTGLVEAVEHLAVDVELELAARRI